jgi:hypothetical protein
MLIDTQIISRAAIALFMTLGITGCGSNSHESRMLATNAVYEIAASDTLIIHIEDKNGSNDTNGSVMPDNNATEEPGSQNESPIAVVHANGGQQYVSVHVGEPVFFTSEGSYDPDGTITRYIWTDMDDNVLSTDANFTRTFYSPAIYEKTLTVTDDKNASAYARVCILADITPTDIALIAHAGPDIFTTAGTPVSIEGRAICKSGDFSYAWYEVGSLLSSEATLHHIFGTGTHTLHFRVTDNATGMYAVDSVTIHVADAVTGD